MTPKPRRAADLLPPNPHQLDPLHAEDETLSEYSERMRDKYPRKEVLALLKALTPTHTYRRKSSR